jgi:hypothetical protein
MRITFYLPLLAISTFVAHAQVDVALTNHVPLRNRGLSFSISDGSKQDDIARFSTKEVFSDVRLVWALDNTAEKEIGIRSPGVQPTTFLLRLFDNAGKEVPLTEFGKYISGGPRTNHVTVAESIHFIRLSPGQTSIQYFYRIDWLFQIPKPGDYTFEARYWYIEIAPRQWKLSDPVRLKVIKRPDKNANVGMTNAPSQ